MDLTCHPPRGIKGIISRIESKDYYLLVDDKIIRCSLKGKLKLDNKLKKDKLYQTDFAAVGDLVVFDFNEDGTGVIHTIEARKNYLSRKAPKVKGSGFRGERLEQIVAANLDYLFIVTSIAQPSFNNKVADRFLVAAESSGIAAVIIINKSDLDKENNSGYWIDLYKSIGYNIIITSAFTGEGLDKIKNMLKGKRSLFWGQSGVGKSSLLNKLFPSLNLEIGKISSYHNKGIHTTVTSILLKIDDDTFIIDTPGIREIDPYGIRKEDLSHYFKEFTDYIYSCRFNTCTHDHEPGCAVIDAVEKEKIPVERYESYLRILATVEKDMIF